MLAINQRKEGKAVQPKNEWDPLEWPQNTKLRTVLVADKKYLSAPLSPTLRVMECLGIATKDSNTSCHCSVPVNLQLPTGVASSLISFCRKLNSDLIQIPPKVRKIRACRKIKALASRGGQLLIQEHVLLVAGPNMPHISAGHTWCMVPGIAEAPNTGSHTR